MLPDAKATLLIVDDEVSTRTSLSSIFLQLGYSVRSAEDGFSALFEIRREIPYIILSDLNMPGMSGFELLSIVRRRFPAIQVIAMSGAFSGDGVPAEVAADAFYEKGTSLGSLLQIVEDMTKPDQRRSLQPTRARAPICIPPNGHNPSGERYVVITCPECLRSFPQVLDGAICSIRETTCVYCSSLIDYAIVQAAEPRPQPAYQPKPCSEDQAILIATDLQ